MTTSIENNRKRKRNVPRGILTPRERERLEKGVVTRQLRRTVRGKTIQTLVIDFPLIFQKMDFYGFDFPKTFYLPIIELYFNLVKTKMLKERLEHKVKHKVSDKMVWRRLVREAEGYRQTAQS
jgi:hypothetical protein